MTSPWLAVPADEYESHMAAAHVGQRSALDAIFREILLKLKPRRILMAGCGPGGGWEEIDPATTELVTGVDLNHEYLQVVQQRHGGKLRGLELICGDILSLDLIGRRYDLVVAALLFEYIDVKEGLQRLSDMLDTEGALLVVLQLPSTASAPVSETSFDSIRSLAGIIKLVDPAEFETVARSVGLCSSWNNVVPLPGGKAFFVQLLQPRPLQVTGENFSAEV